MIPETLLEYATLTAEFDRLHADFDACKLDTENHARFLDVTRRMGEIEDEARTAFTVQDADRLLKVGDDEFIEEANADRDITVARIEWDLLRPALVEAPALLKAAIAVVERWASGDLGEAVRGLDEAVRATRRRSV